MSRDRLTPVPKDHYISVAGAEIAAMALYYHEADHLTGKPWHELSPETRARYRLTVHATMQEAIDQREAK